MDIDNFSLEEGTIEFWVKKNKFAWDNNEEIELFEVSRDEEGKVSIIKDAKNNLKAIYRKGKEKAQTSADVSELSKEKRHMVAFSWSYDDNEISLYLDREKIAHATIR